MTMKQFESEVKFLSENMYTLSRKDVQEMQERLLPKKNWSINIKKADKILDKYGYSKVTWREWNKRMQEMRTH